MSEDNSSNSVATNGENEQREAIELRAYQLWQDRGSPIGSPDEDWLRAEQETLGQGRALVEQSEPRATQAQVAAA